jgi:hypothetical protein
MEKKIIKSYSQDRRLGQSFESNHLVIKQLDDTFNCKLTKSKHHFSRYDFKDKEKKIYVEMKNRRVSHHQFPSTMIGKVKYDFAMRKLEKGYTTYFVFGFEDGHLAYIKVTENEFKDFEIRKFKRSFRYDARDLECDYIFIPMIKLIDITPCIL